MEVGGKRHAPAALTPRKRPGIHCTESWMGPRADLWKGAEILAPTGIRSPDRSSHGDFLYRLRYPGPHCSSDKSIRLFRPLQRGPNK
jgi:hypothetical protein